MKISIQSTDDALIVALTGILDAWNVLEIGTELKRSIESSTTCVIIDLSNLDEISSTGINILLGCHEWLRDHGRNLVLAGAKGGVAESLRIRRISEQVCMLGRVDDAQNMVSPTLEISMRSKND